MASNVLSMAGWYILPGLVTSYIQPILYTIFIRAGDAKPAPNSTRFVNDRRRIQIAVIALYLVYTIYEADHQLRQVPDFYSALGISHDATEREINSRFRRLTVQFHPDKVAATADRQAVEAIYVQLKLARDTLIDPVKRFAYDRFGPDILSWRTCTAVRDFVYIGVQRTIVYYAMSGIALIVLSMLGYFQSGKFWRYTVMAAMLLIETHTLTRPTFPAYLTKVANPLLVATKLRPPYLPFQILTLLRKVAVTVFIAIAQLGPLLKDPRSAATEQDGDKITEQQLARLDAFAKQTDVELTRLMSLELAPFASEAGMVRDLKASIRSWLVQNTIRNDPEVRRAMSAVLDRRRGDEVGELRLGAR